MNTLFLFLVLALFALVFFFAFRSFFKNIGANRRSTPLSRSRFYGGRQEHLPDDFLADREKKDESTASHIL